MLSLPDIVAVARQIDDELPELARRVISSHLDLSDPDNQAFLLAPDKREHHQTQWHQWGILTHTRKFLQLYDHEVPLYLDEWGVRSQVDAHLREQVDGIAKAELLRVTILLHDLGKFAVRTKGPRRFHFRRHEKSSGDLVLRQLDLPRYGLTQPQIQYVALTAGDHFVLGLMRKRARERGQYDETYVRSQDFVEAARSIMSQHPDDFVEVGVLFLGDSLAKVEPENGPELAVSQYEMNVRVAHRYLDVVLNGS